MMLWLLPALFIGGLTGWLLTSLAVKLLFRTKTLPKTSGDTPQRKVPASQLLLAEKAGNYAAELLPISEIEHKLTNAETLQKVMPFIEEHIDHFLRVKLGKSMPVIGMFIGDKTIAQLKGVFMEELETLFPEIMKNYTQQLQKDFNPAELISKRIATADPTEIEALMAPLLSKKIRAIKIAGALMGIVIALIQFMLVVMAYNFK
jgi:uncharacterized membrane protein YheB (UPF0754 family)